MLNSLSSNAVLAKARTMYGKRLTAADYKELLKCSGIGEVAAYLKDHTVYARMMAGVTEREVHRAELESRLRQKLKDDYSSLCRYEAEVDKYFSRIFTARDEIEYLLHAVIRLNSGASGKPEYRVPGYLIHDSRLNFQALSAIRKPADLRLVIRGTQYGRLLEPFLKEEEERLDYVGIESALYSRYFVLFRKTIQKHFSGTQQRELLHIFDTYADLSNYVRIVRMRVMYKMDPEATKKMLLPSGTLREDELDRMVQGTSEAQITDALQQTGIGRRAAKYDPAYLDQFPACLTFQACRHDMDYSIYPAVVLLAYFFLSRTEIHNIITIIEGKRYQLPAEEIQRLLILEGSGLSESVQKGE